MPLYRTGYPHHDALPYREDDSVTFVQGNSCSVKEYKIVARCREQVHFVGEQGVQKGIKASFGQPSNFWSTKRQQNVMHSSQTNVMHSTKASSVLIRHSLICVRTKVKF